MHTLYWCEARCIPPAKLNDWMTPEAPVNHWRQSAGGRQTDPQLSCCTRMLHVLGEAECQVKDRLLQSDLQDQSYTSNSS